MLDYVSYPGFACRIRAERELQRLDKLTGSQRYVGLIFPDDAMRQVFLGTLVLGDETPRDAIWRGPDRDVAGFVERIGDNRWRLIMPKPHFESQFDVMELVPSPRMTVDETEARSCRCRLDVPPTATRRHALADAIRADMPQLMALYRDLHANPELRCRRCARRRSSRPRCASSAST